MKLSHQLISVLSLLVMSVSSYAQPEKMVDEDHTLTEKKTSIVVTPENRQFIIKLRSNPSTGYSWYLREYNSKLITPVEHSYHHADTKVVGASGFEEWVFRANRAAFLVPQQTALRMAYVRPWQTDENSKQIVFRISTVNKN